MRSASMSARSIRSVNGVVFSWICVLTKNFEVPFGLPKKSDGTGGVDGALGEGGEAFSFPAPAGDANDGSVTNVCSTKNSELPSSSQRLPSRTLAISANWTWPSASAAAPPRLPWRRRFRSRPSARPPKQRDVAAPIAPSLSRGSPAASDSSPSRPSSQNKQDRSLGPPPEGAASRSEQRECALLCLVLRGGSGSDGRKLWGGSAVGDAAGRLGSAAEGARTLEIGQPTMELSAAGVERTFNALAGRYAFKAVIALCVLYVLSSVMSLDGRTRAMDLVDDANLMGDLRRQRSNPLGIIASQVHHTKGHAHKSVNPGHGKRKRIRHPTDTGDHADAQTPAAQEQMPPPTAPTATPGRPARRRGTRGGAGRRRPSNEDKDKTLAPVGHSTCARCSYVGVCVRARGASEVRCRCPALYEGPACERVRAFPKPDCMASFQGRYDGYLAMSADGLANVSSIQVSKNPVSAKRSKSRLASIAKVTPGLLSVLPAKDPLYRRAFKSCAVVGSSGIVLGFEAGASIDKHDMVVSPSPFSLPCHAIRAKK